MEIKPNRVPTYQFTADRNDGHDLLRIYELCHRISKHNKIHPEKEDRLRVELRGRVQKHWTDPTFDEHGNIVGGIQNSKIVDVYVYPR